MTHETIDPAVLFRPELGEKPPHDSVDMCLDPPMSISKLWHRAADAS